MGDAIAVPPRFAARERHPARRRKRQKLERASERRYA
jgi:rRNA maturation protein Nop10